MFSNLDNSHDIQLHCYTDASKKAYSAAVYVRYLSRSEFKTNLLFCKTRVAPKKIISISRLELLGALIGAKCLMFVAKAIRLETNSKYL